MLTDPGGPKPRWAYILHQRKYKMAEAAINAYLQEHQVEALLKDVVLELCKSKPTNVHAFIRDYMNAKMQSAANEEDEEPAINA